MYKLTTYIAHIEYITNMQTPLININAVCKAGTLT